MLIDNVLKMDGTFMCPTSIQRYISKRSCSRKTLHNYVECSIRGIQDWNIQRLHNDDTCNRATCPTVLYMWTMDGRRVMMGVRGQVDNQQVLDETCSMAIQCMVRLGAAGGGGMADEI